MGRYSLSYLIDGSPRLSCSPLRGFSLRDSAPTCQQRILFDHSYGFSCFQYDHHAVAQPYAAISTPSSTLNLLDIASEVRDSIFNHLTCLVCRLVAACIHYLQIDCEINMNNSGQWPLADTVLGVPWDLKD
jgi:hypothetical protein